MKIYISGKISGLKIEDSKVLFAKAWFELMASKQFQLAINPFNLDQSKNKTWFQYMLTDLKALNHCQAIYMINNWKTSKGAWIELIFSIITFKKIYFQ